MLSRDSYNFCWPVRTLRQAHERGRWQQRTPAGIRRQHPPREPGHAMGPSIASAPAAPGIDLVARLAVVLGVPVADLLPTTPILDDLAVTRQQARSLFDLLLQSEDRAVLILLTQLLARLAESTNR